MLLASLEVEHDEKMMIAIAIIKLPDASFNFINTFLLLIYKMRNASAIPFQLWCQSKKGSIT
jgi:hypothetical protein